jgi:hypothetical protein
MEKFKEITVDDFLDAIEKNGLTKLQYSYVDDIKTITAGCAFGQAAVNLDVDPSSLRLNISNISFILMSGVINDNDHTEMTLPEIARKWREKYSEKFRSRKMEVRVRDYSNSEIIRNANPSN